MGMAENIKALRLEKGWTQEELGKRLGVQKSAIAKYEKGVVTNMKRSVIQQMSELFGVSPSYLMGFPESDESASSSDSQGYYINQETAQVAQKIMENKELGLLFSAASDASPEDLLTVHQMLLALKRKEQSD